MGFWGVSVFSYILSSVCLDREKNLSFSSGCLRCAKFCKTDFGFLQLVIQLWIVTLGIFFSNKNMLDSFERRVNLTLVRGQPVWLIISEMNCLYLKCSLQLGGKSTLFVERP